MQKLMESIYSQIQAIEMCIEKRFIDSAFILINNILFLWVKEVGFG